MLKYFVSFTFLENGKQEFGWGTVESDHYFTNEQDIVEVTEALMAREGKDKIIVLYFTLMANSSLSPMRVSQSSLYKTN